MGGWRVGRIAGIEIRVDPSWSIIAVLFTVSFWAEFSDRTRFPGLSSGTALVLAIVASALFFGSVLGHELAHAVMSKARRIPVRGITLFLFGGATQADVESRGPADEFLVTVVGPLTSLGLGVAFLAGYFAGGGSLGEGGLVGFFRHGAVGPGTVRQALFGLLARVNLLLGVFNLLPGFPLDGGRLLRSALWRGTGSLERATVIAARVGEAIASLIIVWGVVMGIQSRDVLAGLWPVMIGWFLLRAARSTRMIGERRRILTSTRVRDVMGNPPPTIPATLPLGTAIDVFLDGHDGEAFPVVTDQGVVGFVSLRTAQGVPADRPVEEAMVGTDAVLQAGPDEPMEAVARRLGEQQRNTILVVDGGRLVGVIEPEDIERFFRLGASPRRRQDRPSRPDIPPSV
jgi:Zn-dependent protease/predicted transcriptional regulator